MDTITDFMVLNHLTESGPITCFPVNRRFIIVTTIMLCTQITLTQYKVCWTYMVQSQSQPKSLQHMQGLPYQSQQETPEQILSSRYSDIYNEDSLISLRCTVLPLTSFARNNFSRILPRQTPLPMARWQEEFPNQVLE